MLRCVATVELPSHSNLCPHGVVKWRGVFWIR